MHSNFYLTTTGVFNPLIIDGEVEIFSSNHSTSEAKAFSYTSTLSGTLNDLDGYRGSWKGKEANNQ